MIKAFIFLPIFLLMGIGLSISLNTSLLHSAGQASSYYGQELEKEEMQQDINSMINIGGEQYSIDEYYNEF